MSAPVFMFKKLSISNNMQSSSSNAAKQLSGSGKGKAPMVEPYAEESDEDSGSEDEEETTEQAEAEARRVFAIDYCRQIGSLYAFQIVYAEVKPAGIRITTDGFTCSCGDSPTCSHRTSLLQQLYPVLPPTTSIQTTSSPYEQITTAGLPEVCNALHCELRNQPDEVMEDNWRLRKDYFARRRGKKTENMLQERMVVIRDIMATLSPHTTDEYRDDLFAVQSDSPPGPVLGDLSATISRYLLFDDDAFHYFDIMVSRDTRATDYFNKTFHKASAACRALDKYSEVGPVDGKHHSLIWCADTLTALVQSIQANLFTRQPLSSTARQAAAKALVDILELVVGRNVEVYTHSTWARQKRHLEPTQDRNLYVRLIFNPPHGSDDLFVLRELRDLPEAQPCGQRLVKILKTLRQVAWQAPRHYIVELENIITRLGFSIDTQTTPRRSHAAGEVQTPRSTTARGQGSFSHGPSTRSGRLHSDSPAVGSSTRSDRMPSNSPEPGSSSAPGKRSLTGAKESESKKRMK